MRHLIAAFLFAALFLSIGGEASAYSIRDDATGGDCTLIGSWDEATKTCKMTNDLFGAIRLDNDDVTLNCSGHTLSGSSGEAEGVYIAGRKGITVKNCNVQNFQFGIYVTSSNNNTLVDNVASSNYQVGILIQFGGDNRVIANTVKSSGYYGIFVYAGSNNILMSNTITNNQTGISIYGGFNAISGNFVSYNTHGIYVIYSSDNEIHKNTLSYNGHGVYLDYSSNIKVYNNNFIDNSTQAIDWRGVNNVFYLDMPSGGNYWNNFDTTSEGCYDANRDGVCDSPYYFFPERFYGFVDYFPWAVQDGWLTAPEMVPATVDIKPDTLNKRSASAGNALTAYIEIPNHDLSQVNISSVSLRTSQGFVFAQRSPIEIGDYDNDGIADLMIKFDRQKVITIVKGAEESRIEVIGSVGNKVFSGYDTIKVVE